MRPFCGRGTTLLVAQRSTLVDWHRGQPVTRDRRGGTGDASDARLVLRLTRV